MTSAQENLRKVLTEFDSDLDYLLSQQVLTRLDVQKIRSQAEVSKNALLAARDETSFSDSAKDKLLNALVLDFEKSIQRILDEAIGKKGDKELLIYRLNKIDKKLRTNATQMNFTSNDLKLLQLGMDLVKSYVIKACPEKNSRWGSSKIDVGQIINSYEQTFIEYIRENKGQPRLIR